MSDSIEILEATLAGSEKAVRDRDQEIALLKATIKGLEAALELANEKYADRDREIAELNSEIETTSKIAANFEEMLAKSDRKITILEDSLDRARADHLEQLRAIVQMLQPLIGRPYNSTENKDGKIYVHVNHTNEFTHVEKNHAIKLIQKVIYANIKRLDPCLTPSSYDDDF